MKIPQRCTWVRTIVLLAILTKPTLSGQPDIDLSSVEPQVRQAIESAHQHALQNPSAPDAWGRYGMLLDAHGFAAIAIDAYATARQHAPRDMRWPYYTAVLLQDRDATAALSHYQAALAIKADYAPAHVRFARLLLRLGREEEALRHFRTARDLDPESAVVHLGIGQLFLARGDMEDARVSLEKAVALQPGNSAAHAALARLCRRTGDRDAALQHARAARLSVGTFMIEDPLHFEVQKMGLRIGSFLRRGALYRQQGKLADAIAEYQRALEFNPDDAHVHASLALVSLDQNRPREALSHTNKALELLPQIRGQHALRAQALMKLNQLDQAEESALRACDEDPDSPGYLFLLGTIRVQKRDLQRALPSLARAVELDPDHLQRRITLARTLLAMQKSHDATKHLESATTIAPRNVDAWRLLGLARMQSSDWLEAEEALRTAVELGARDEIVDRAWATSLQKLGRFNEAVKHLEDSLKRSGSDEVANDLAWLLATCPNDDIRQGMRALELAQRITQSPAGRTPARLDTLAASYAEVGRFEDAVRTIDEAIHALPTGENSTDSAYTARRELYRASKPYRSGNGH